MYIEYDKKEGKKKIPYMENWDFYFSLKNDSTAIIQDIKSKKVLPAKEYSISRVKDSAIVKRMASGKIVETEKFYFYKIKM